MSEKQDCELEKQDQQQEARPCKPGTFQKGDLRINRAGAPRKESSDPRVPLLLCDLRHVYNRPKSADKTPGQRMLRKLFEEDPGKFVYRLQKFELEYQAEARKLVKAAVPEETDIPLENAAALFRNLLKDRQAEQAKEDAELAKRPDAAAIAGTLQKRLEASLQREAMLRAELDKLQRPG